MFCRLISAQRLLANHRNAASLLQHDSGICADRGLLYERPGKEAPLQLIDLPPWPTNQAPANEFRDEGSRLRVLASFDVDGLEGDAELAHLARFAANLCNASSAAISLVEEERQRFVASEGMQQSETPRSTSFCAYAMMGSDLFEVLDATRDERFRDFALVRGEEHIRYYAGVPLISSEGAPLGALCILDTEPRAQGLDALQREGLTVLAESVRRRLEAHRQSHLAVFELKESAERLQFMLDSVPDIAWSAAPGPVFDHFNARFTEVTGKPPPSEVDDWRAFVHPDDFEASLVKFQYSMENATLFEDEWRLRLADGSYRYVLSRAVPSSDDPATARWFGTLTDIDDRYRLSQERELLAGELAHRIKNVFSVITGLISLRSRNQPEQRDFTEALNANIRALARAQEYALPGARAGENLQELLGVLMKPYGADGSDVVQISGDEASFGPRAATPLALVFHELATNSAKYGALSSSNGRVTITVTSLDDAIAITWQERGGPEVSTPDDSGFGSRLLAMTIENQLGGSIERSWETEGLTATITLPLERLEN